MKDILAPVSLGELIDKITILEIKRENLDGRQLENVKHELTKLTAILDHVKINVDKSVVDKLRGINQDLWQIEDAIRELERKKNFGQEFVQLARSVYQTNDLRSAIKKEINLSHNSTIVEEKSYQRY